MIYDFGCGTYGSLISKLPSALIGVAAVLAIFAGLSALGSLARRALGAATGQGWSFPTNFCPNDFFVGWGFSAAILTLTVTLSHQLVAPISAILAVAMGAAIVVLLPHRYFRSVFWLMAIFPGILVLSAINLAGLSGWDDFSHWVPNALYLYHYNAVPGHGLPEPHSVWPAYPYALPYLTYLSSKLAAGFLMQGGAMFSFLLLLVFAAKLAYGQDATQGRALSSRSIALVGLALLITTLFNPGFNASFSISNGGDTAAMVLTGILALLAVDLIDALARQARPESREQAAIMAVSAMAYVAIKQVDVYLLFMLAGGLIIVAAKNRILKPALSLLPFIFLPAIALHFVWAHYAAAEMPRAGFGIKPLPEWRIDLAADLLKAMLHEAIKKNGLFLLVAAAMTAGTAALFRPTSKQNNLAILALFVCGFYAVFLFLAYLGSSFSEPEIRRAASFYRYMTHIGLVATAWLWLFASALLRQRPQILSPRNEKLAAIGLISLLPLALIIHSGWLVRGTAPETCAIRDLARKVTQALPEQRDLDIIDAEGEGYFGTVINFEGAVQEMTTGHALIVRNNYNSLTVAPTTDLSQHFQNLAPGAAALIRRAANPKFPLPNLTNYNADPTQLAVLVQWQGRRGWVSIPLSSSH